MVPPRVGDMLSYSLRNSDQCQTIDTKSQLYYNSFLPSAVREWNALDSESQSCPSVPSFKRSISNRQLSQTIILLEAELNKYYMLD